MQRLRGGGIAAFVLIAAIAAVPVPASASPPPNTIDRQPIVTPRADAPSFVTKSDIVAGVTVVELSQRTRDSIQLDAVSHALSVAVRSDDSLSVGSFNRDLIESLLDEHGLETAKTIVKSYRPSADRYRLLLRILNDRSLASSTQLRRRI